MTTPGTIQRCSRLSIIAAFGCGAALSAYAGTVDFVFSVHGGSLLTLVGPPPTTTPVDSVYNGSGLSTPFGPFSDTEKNEITFVHYPDRLAPGSETGTFTFSFNGGEDTLTGVLNVVYANDPTKPGPALTNSQTRTILGGTGIFAGASGTLLATGDDAPNPTPPPTAFNDFSGTGQITAPGLTAVPEPASAPVVAAVLSAAFSLRRLGRAKREPRAAG
jgi:hypothetical protein